MTTSVVWFRRDLRLHDHPALTAAQADGDRIAPLFVIDERLQGGRFRSANRLWFMRGSVSALAAALDVRGAPLSVVRGDPSEVVPAFAAAVGAGRVVASRDYTPYGRGRDDRVAAALGRRGIAWGTLPGLLIHEPEDVATANAGRSACSGRFGEPGSSDPNATSWRRPDAIAGVGTSRRSQGRGCPRNGDSQRRSSRCCRPPGRTPLGSASLVGPRRGHSSGTRRTATGWTSRGRPVWARTCAGGCISPTEVGGPLCWGGRGSASASSSELAWRDFYAHLLWHEPRAARASWRPSLERVAWEHDPRIIDAWRTGRTGFPVVDAAMRQLTTSGWMHNRARMIAASFLTKHLGVDWRVGEQYFMEHLIDGDPASNNGGWQWAASTGTDAQPWFRIFNPTLQAIRHDPDGAYVRLWLPELAGLEGQAVHAPPPGTYLDPIVDHREARARALTAYRDATRT